MTVKKETFNAYQITIRANQQIKRSHRIQNEHIKIRHFCALIGIWNWTHLQQQQRVKILEDKLRIWKKQAESKNKQKGSWTRKINIVKIFLLPKATH